MNTKKRAIIALVLLAVVLVINQLGATGAINGMSQKDVSDKYPTLLTPEPLAFGIWLVIYGLVLIVLVMALIKNKEPWAERLMRSISIPFYISCIINILWIVTFSYELLGIGAILTLAYAITMAILCERLLKNRKEPMNIPALGFGIYLGWLLMATVLNISSWLVKIKWDRFGLADNLWAVIILGVAVVLTFIIAKKVHNAAVPISGAWAYFNIFLKHRSPEGYAGMYPMIQWASLIGCVLLVVSIVVIYIQNNKGILPNFYKTDKGWFY